MTLSKKELERLAEAYQKKYDAAFRNYQDTGIGRYATAARRAEDMADALRMAANAADEHAAHVDMKGQLANFAWRAASIKSGGLPPAEAQAKTDALISELVAYGQLLGLIREDRGLEK